MEYNEYQKMSELEDTYWWHTGRESIVDNQLRGLNLGPESHILNIGSGTGGTVPMISKYGKVFNVDVSDEAIKYAQQKGIENLYKVDGIQLPFEDNSFDCVIGLDVLEHIEDDVAALREWQRVTKPNGKIIITIPAHDWLWSEHDESLHHIRRYNVSGVHRIVGRSGWHVVKRTYMIVFSFPMIVAYRFLRSLVPKKGPSTSYVMLPKPVNNFFSFLLKLEGQILKVANFPVGTSILVVGEKPSTN